MKKFVIKLVLAIMIITCFFSFYGCSLYSFKNEFSNYNKFLENRFLYGDYSPSKPEIIVPKIETYSPIIKDEFSNVIIGDSSYCYVEKNSKKYILNAQNEFFEIKDEIEILSLSGNYAITIKNNKKGISKLPNLEEVIGHNFSHIQIIGDTFLTLIDACTKIYYKEVKTYEERTFKIDILKDGVLISNGALRDVYNNILSYKNYPIAVIYSDNNFLYETPSGYGIFYNGNEIPGFYYFADKFISGRACVAFNEKNYAVINEKGEVLFKIDNGEIFNLYDGYHLAKIGSNYYIYNDKFELIKSTILNNVYGSRIYNKYIISKFDNNYSFINLNTFNEEAVFKDLVNFNHDFIGKAENGTFSIFNDDLTFYEKDIQEVKVGKNILAAKINGKFYLYEKGDVNDF